MKDYGPVQEFCFKQYNGILGNQPSNNKSIEPQLMQRFLNDSMTKSLIESQSDDFKEEFLESVTTNKSAGSVLETVVSELSQLPSKYSRGVLSSDEVDALKQLYSKVANTDEPIFVNSVFQKFESITINGKEYSSSGKQRTIRGVVQASWDTVLYGNPPTTLPSNSLVPSSLRPVNIHYFMKVFFTVNDSTISVLFANVSWFYPHPEKYALGKPAELWCRSQYETFGLHSYIPINLLLRRCAYDTTFWFRNEEVLVVIPLVE